MPYSKYYRELSTATASIIPICLYIDLKTLLPDAYMEKVDKLRWLGGLENALMPFLDPRLVELACSIPSRWSGGCRRS